jgi:phosphatidylserine/phosphatidylglycerophosphate/cardiolipin synthase-like enzyme
MGKRAVCAAVILSVLGITSSHAIARKGMLEEVRAAVAGATSPSSTVVPATGEVEVAFSPNEGSEALVIKAIDAARKEIRMLAYSFTSAPVTAALLRAKKRGVDVAVVVDYRNNVTEDRSGKARAALGTLATAGIALRTIRAYPIHHDKTVIVDGAHVETGSFNYSDAAARKNSENVMVLWDNPKLAAVFKRHWERNWTQGDNYRPGF